MNLFMKRILQSIIKILISTKVQTPNYFMANHFSNLNYNLRLTPEKCVRRYNYNYLSTRYQSNYAGAIGLQREVYSHIHVTTSNSIG